MTRTHVDIETYSEADLKKEGLYRYAQHSSTDINVFCWAVSDGPVNVWMPWNDIPKAIINALKPGMDKFGVIFTGSDVPVSVKQIFLDAVVAAHNAQFERVVLNNWLERKSLYSGIEIDRTICTMAKCAVHGIPQALEHAAKAMDTYPKRADGATEMRYFAKPRKDGTRPTPYDEPKRFITLVKYCIDDVKAERDLDVNISDLTEREMQVYRLDQRINERGVARDLQAVDNAIYLVDQYKKKLARLCKEQTGFNPGQTQQIAEWVRANGYPGLENLQAPTVLEALENPAVPESVKPILKCYSVHASKSVSKFEAMKRAATDDGRLHGMFQYYGAGPGRWSSRIVQLQNMMRPVIKDVDAAIEAMKCRSLNWMRWLWPDIDPMKVFGSTTRGMLIAAPGRDLMAYDFAQIESRIQAWLANAEWKLKAFREDRIKIYKITGAMMFGLQPSEIVDKGESQLYTSAKIGELACGYQGWEAAIRKMAKQQGMKLLLDPVEIASRWREANVEQVELWPELNNAAIWAVRNKGNAYTIPNKRIVFKVVDRWLCMQLPSKRKIYYLDPEIGKSNHDGKECVTYMGIDTDTRRYMRIDGYGGRWLQNACEGIGRDLLVNGLLNMEVAGYSTIMSVHDEGVFEVDEDFGSDEEATRLMTVPLQWAEGLPVKCEGWRAKRYRK